MRNTFGKWMAELASANEKAFLLSGDIGFGIFDELIEKKPSHFINCGIAEQNMIGVAAGMAAQGLVPFVYTIIPFLVLRPFEFIRNLIAHQKLKVVLIGVGGGFAYDNLGFTHYAKEDLVLISTLPNFNIFVPYDPNSARCAFERALNSEKASYVRLMKGGEPPLEILEAYDGFDKLSSLGEDFSLVTYGGTCSSAIQALEILKCNNLNGSVYAIWDFEKVEELRQTVNGPCFIIEEQVFPGVLYPQMAADKNNRSKFEFIGIQKNRDNKLSSRLDILSMHGLDPSSLAELVATEMTQK